VLDRVIDGSLLAAADPTSPPGVPVLVLASDAALSALPPAHEARLPPEVEVVRLPGATHTLHDEIAHRPAYERQLTAFLRCASAM
jgi:pimeloyl-ACP methyl ester carboxylesterase